MNTKNYIQKRLENIGLYLDMETDNCWDVKIYYLAKVMRKLLRQMAAVIFS